MEMDVNLSKASAVELMTISAGSYNSNNNGALPRSLSPPRIQSNSPARTRIGCCGILSRLLCSSSGRSSHKTASSSSDYNNYNGNIATLPISNINPRRIQNRRTPQEIYFESRGKSCKKLLKFNGNSNKILLYPEEGWARTASSSYWTITPCWWQPNRCRIEEFAGTQRHSTKAKMVPLEQKGSLLIAGNFRNNNSKNSTNNTNHTNNSNSNSNSSSNHNSSNGSRNGNRKDKDTDEFKLYLSSNISMEDYNMGYCLTGFVERRCQQTNTFQMTHFAVIKRQWPSISSSDAKST